MNVWIVVLYMLNLGGACWVGEETDQWERIYDETEIGKAVRLAPADTAREWGEGAAFFGRLRRNNAPFAYHEYKVVPRNAPGGQLTHGKAR